MKSNEDENEMSSGNDVVFSPPLYIQRYQMVLDVLTKTDNISKIADFGCAEGKMMRRLKRFPDVDELAFIDCDDYTLQMCINECRPLPYDYLFADRNKPMKAIVYNGSVAQKDSRLKSFDAIICIELIEHLTPDVLSELPANIFGFIEPKVAIITTPNVEYNVVFPQLRESGGFRHWDHKFEWTRHEFDVWCQSVCKQYSQYTYEMTGVGQPPPNGDYNDIGFCTQIAVFRKICYDSNDCEDIDSNLNHNNNNCLNYKIVDTFDYPVNTRIQPKVEEFVDWPSVCN